MSVVWTGMLLVQASSLLLHLELDGSRKLPQFSLMPTAAVLFICGVFAGRLLLRRELRLAERREAAR